ncbi:MAG: dihydroorotate dehydrogenase-like protein [Bacteroidaceae bacterium]|jgi:dihydroorotate dehydrogenase (fumarate)|nr:dihydroorotate dehydrogenase-like protein [Bacteroidaceae bacterium]
MKTLETTYAGLKLKNPIIVSSSSLTDSAEKNKKLCEAGAGAIVLKSLFEEQILLEVEDMEDFDPFVVGGNDLSEYFRHQKLEEYFELIRATKKVVDIPVIASINAYGMGNWTEFAKKIEKAGADALEINILALQTSLDYQYGEFEKKHINILKLIKKAVKIPVIMKLGDNFTNPVALIHQLRAHGADGVVLFNRFYPTDINIDKVEQCSGKAFTTEADLSKPLRWTGIASAAISNYSFAVSGGVHNAAGVVKSILAGASAVEVCSAIYLKGNGIIKEMTVGLMEWMDSHTMDDISMFKGMLNMQYRNEGINTFERTQFLKYYGQFKK